MTPSPSQSVLQKIGPWLAVLLLAAVGCWLLLDNPPMTTTTSAPAPAPATSQPPPGPLSAPAARRIPLGTDRTPPATQDEANATAQVALEYDPSDQPPGPWSTPELQANPDLADAEWIPSDHSAGDQRAPVEIGDEPSPPETPPGEARRQLGQVFPHHLPDDTPGSEEAIDAAREALEQDLDSTALGQNLQHVAALILTPKDDLEPGATLGDWGIVEVVLQVQIQTQMGTQEARIYRVTLMTQSTTSPQQWTLGSISIV